MDFGTIVERGPDGILPVDAGVSVSHLPKGVLIVRGSGGWVKKTVTD
jgi:hypothetical protein